MPTKIKLFNNRWSVITRSGRLKTGGLIVAGLVLAVYFTTVAKFPVGYGDSDELMGIGYLLGLPHSPGYPLLTVLVYLMTHLIPWGSIAWRANLVAVLSQCLTVITVYLISLEILDLIKPKIPTEIKILTAAVASWGLAFNYLFWLYANVLEVFPLNNFLSALVIYLTLKIWRHKHIKWWWWWTITLGILITHHQSSLLLMPSLIILLWPGSEAGPRVNWRRVIGGLVIIIAVIGLNLVGIKWLGGRPSAWTWTNGSTLKNLWHYQIRGIYQGVSIEQGTTLSAYGGRLQLRPSLASLSHYLSVALPAHFGWGLMAVMLVGLIYGWKVLPKRWWWALALACLLTGPAVAVYLSLPDLTALALTERMYLLNYVLLALWLPVGWVWFYRHWPLFIFGGLTLGLIGWSILINYPGVNRQQDRWLSDDLANWLRQLPARSTVVCGSDISCFGLLYQQKVMRLRSDVYILPISPQMNYTEYLNQAKISQRFSYPDNPFRVADTISWSVAMHRSVWLTEIPDFYRNLLGITGQNYQLEPGFPGSQVNDPNESEPPVEIKTDGDNILPMDSRNTWLLVQRNWYEQALKPMPKSHNEVDTFRRLWWATLKQPLNLSYRNQLAHYYLEQGFPTLAKREYRNLYLIDPQNATAAAKLAELKQIQDLQGLPGQ